MTRASDKISHRYANELDCLPPGPPNTAQLQIAFNALETIGHEDIGQRLRVLRQIVLYRLWHLDCEQGAPLEVVTQGMTDLAEFCLEVAVRHSREALEAKHGTPADKSGNPCQLWVVGMGKLGARELNVSSDIDLIFVYESDGESRPLAPNATPVSNPIFFAEQVRMIGQLLGAVTEHGFVFRIDLALRPYGREGALALSLHSLSQYFQRSGREWERFAWLKSRVLGSDSVLPLRAVVRSFVFRRFLDYKVFTSLRELHQLIRKNVKPAERETNIKLGRGGIREIEFIAQVQQIVRGGRQPELLARPTLTALNRLEQARLLSRDQRVSLSAAYDFFRKTEHRIQYLDDAQTHVLPQDPSDQSWLAHSMGYASWPLFLVELNRHRELVAIFFEQWLTQGEVLRQPQNRMAMLEQLHQKAPWTIQYVRKHPSVVDELQHADVLTSRFDTELFQQRVKSQYAALQTTGLCDEESVLDLLRRAHQSEVFRILLRDVQGDLSVRDVADELSQLAEAILTLAMPWVWQQLPNRHIRSEELGNHFCVIAYGKLGGRELGYGSDLDVVFLYEDADPNAQLHYIALVRKLITWLTVKTSEGQLYDIDTALRPNGNSGLLVTSIRAYETYQLQRGSNTAWTWELQAMTRARAVFGHSTLIHQFDAIRAQVLRTHRDEATLATEIQAMRNKLRQAHRVPADQFDIKHSPGGMVDAEFVVQFWVLAYSATYPDLMDNLGNIELIKIATVYNLVPALIGQSAADAYQILREKQHQARLQDSKGLIPIEEANIEQAAIQALWDFVFEKKAQ